MRNKRLKIPLRLGIIVLLLAGLAVWLALAPKSRRQPLASVQLADARILQVEDATFGVRHRIGSRSWVLEHFGPWLPQSLRQTLTPQRPFAEINLEAAALVVWVNATDPKTGKHVDCQGIRVEFVDEHGQVFGSEDSHWFGGTSFWRVGHVFEAFPRTHQQLTLQITPWRTNQTSNVRFRNPRVVTPAAWSGKPPPQQRRVGDLDILLSGVELRTNGTPKTRYWQAASPYWEPVLALRQNAEPVSGWDEPEWMAEDPTGNRGKFLGLHQQVLRFSCAFYPCATNAHATVLVASFPKVPVANLQSNILWNSTFRFEKTEILTLGLFPAGTHHFLKGAYQPNPPPSMRMGPVRGGPPSGWITRGKRVNPMRTENWRGHYTRTPVIYLWAKPLDGRQRLAVRLRDENGRSWPAKPEPQGKPDDIQAFLVELPPDVESVTAEIVVLKPVHADFEVVP